MTQNKRESYPSSQEEVASLAAESSATLQMKRELGLGVTSLDDFTLNRSEQSAAMPADSNPQDNPKAETKKPAQNNAKKKRPKKKPKAATADMTSSSASDSTVTPTADSSKVSMISKPRFGFDDYHEELRCQKHGCGKLTNCYDGLTVICP